MGARPGHRKNNLEEKAMGNLCKGFGRDHRKKSFEDEAKGNPYGTHAKVSCCGHLKGIFEEEAIGNPGHGTEDSQGEPWEPMQGGLAMATAI